MMHLLANLLRFHDGPTLALLVLELGFGSLVATGLSIMPDAMSRESGWRRRSLAALGVGAVVSGGMWFGLLTALWGFYPKVGLTVPASWGAPALALAFGIVAATTFVGRPMQRSARNATVSGSLIASGLSCALLTAMAGAVKPFALAYDLGSVLITMVVGSALFAFATWEAGNPARRHRWLVGSVLATLGALGLLLGTLASILPFGGWIQAVSRPDNLACSPIVIVVAAESVVVLVLGLVGSFVDNRVAAHERQEADRFRQLADSTTEGIVIHRDGGILDCNASLARLVGLDPDSLRSVSIASLVPASADASLWTGERGANLAETEILAADGSRVPVEILSRPIVHRGRPALVTALRDVRERRASEERIRFLAHHDALTELPNRVRLHESLDFTLRIAARSGGSVGVLCLDLDGFKAVNDTLGHAAGDHLLCQVALRLRSNVRDCDVVARIGGDEFVVLLASEAGTQQATALAERLIGSLAETFEIEGQDVNVGTSIGIALYPQDGLTSQRLLKNADIALYRAKETGRGCYCLFESGMDKAMMERRALEQDMRTALQRNEFRLEFQPLFDREESLVAFEALVRWLHPTKGLVSPAQFIPFAEESGLIVPIGEWVLRAACQAAMSWERHHNVAVNLSPAQFLKGDIVGSISSVLHETGLDPKRLELEITEGTLISNADLALKTLTALRALGVRIVLDDFGTGYSSLSYLHQFPFDKLKVDRSFVQRLETDETSRAIVSAIISMCRGLRLRVTAEGVETAGQLALLKLQDCDQLQGFLLGRPVSADAAQGLARAGSRVPERV